ncbi:right-handed parallel beta-helix repeat-containing protein [Xylanivirga thermophila]|uniref:hypothetical protein n=1 Tax=Xylanivirga thermophila TaxID=2496273 RepID=UPI00101B61AD|nr:hypothetical protein [Xylanivirga thermophila]
MNEAKDVATLTFFDKFADKGIYTVEVSNVKDVDGNVMKTATEAFIYLAADVAKVEFTQTTVAPGTDLKTVVKVTDKLGRDVSGEVLVEFESSNTDVVGNDGKVGNKANADGKSAIVVSKVKVGDSYVKSAPTTIKVKDALEATFVGFNIYTGTNTVKTTEAFEKLEADEKADFVYVDDYDNNGAATKKLVLYYKDQYGKSLPAAENNLTVTNVTPAIVIVEADGTIKPISAGEGYVKVKANDKLEHTIKIVVRAKSEIATMELDKTDVSVVAGQEATVKVDFKDQFGTKVDKAPTVKSAASTIATATPAENSVVIHGVKEGTTTVAVSYKVNDDLTLKETINVTVVKAGELATYEAVVDATKLDVSNDNDDKDKLPKGTDVVVNEIDVNGNKIGAVKNTNITLTEVDKDGKEIKEEDKKLLTITDNKKVTAKAAGTAYVEVKVGSLVIDTLEFEVVKTAPFAKTAEVENLTLSEKISGVKDTELDKVIKANVVLKDQYGNVMKGTDNKNIQPDTIKYTLTNADGVSVKDDKIEGIKKDKALVDVVLTEVKTTATSDKNLLAAPVVIKLMVNATEVETEQELKDAIVEGNFIVLTEDIGLTKTLDVNKAVIIDGADNTLTGTVIISADDVTLKNLTVDKAMGTPGNWESNNAFAIQAYKVTGIVLENVTMTNANAGLLVNGSKVEVVNGKSVNNPFGGIEVSKGQGVEPEPKLTVNGFTHDTIKTPAIWIDEPNAAGDVNWVVGSGLEAQYLVKAKGDGTTTKYENFAAAETAKDVEEGSGTLQIWFGGQPDSEAEEAEVETPEA